MAASPGHSMLASRRRVAAFALLFCAYSAAANAQTASAISAEVLYPPSPMPTPAGRLLVYELNVHNHDTHDCAALLDVVALGGAAAARIGRHYQGAGIAANTIAYDATMHSVPHKTGHQVEIPPGGGAIIFFTQTLAAQKPVPSLLRHTLTFASCAGAASQDGVHTFVYDVPVHDQPPLSIGAPLRGEDWVAGDASDSRGAHRRTMIPQRDASGQIVPGQFHGPERYAIDWVMIDADGHRERGPIDHNASYYAYGKEVIAVADGVISRVRDGFADATPPHNPPDQTIETAAGNFIMQDIGGGHYAFYAHLQPGSLRVANGQHVTRGQVIALLGNTGNTSEAHLHFHVANANDPLLSEGVPYVFDQFLTTGQVSGFDDTGSYEDVARHDPVPMHGLMPSTDAVLTLQAAHSSRADARPPIRPRP